MITITSRPGYLCIEGHTNADVCSSVSTITYTCYNVLTAFDKNAIEFIDYAENGTSHDKIEMILKNNDTHASLFWQVICQEYEELSKQFPKCVTYNEEKTSN